MKTIHCSLSVRGALANWNARQLSGLFRDDTGRYLGAREAKDHLMDLLVEGVEVLPFGECEGFDPKEGCPGHTKEVET